MPIRYSPKTKQFHLFNKNFSYIINILDNGYIGQVYCGAHLNPDREYPLLSSVPFAGFSNNDRISMRFEYSSYGKGDFRRPAITAIQANGSSVVELEYKSHRIISGKPDIPSLPSIYVENDDEAETLELELEDIPLGIVVILYYTIFHKGNCLTRHSRIINRGKENVVLKNIMSLSLDLDCEDWNLLSFSGAWAREFTITEMPLHPGFQGSESLRGISGHQQQPFLLLKRPHTNEFSGEALGISLIYSGNFLVSVEVDHYGVVRLRAGINPADFSWELNAGASFDTPEAVLVWTESGINALSGDFHWLFQARLARGLWRDRERPVIFNNWEGTYFNFTEERILAMAKTASELGVDLFVLDDGWFGRRDSDDSSLGDWYAYREKLPHGIPYLANKIINLGIQFGLWIEPEMVSKNSRLFEVHPDWAVGIPGRRRTELRQQYVLDMGRPEVVDYLFAVFSELISSAQISYIKWDMNRSITEPYSLTLGPERQGEFFHRYVLGVYDLYSRLVTTFPDVLFESCCSGGGRFDPGMLAYAPQGWISDNTDSYQRLSIQCGASILYPLCSWGSHVSAVPNHQTGRITSLSFRGMVSFFGCLGYELDPEKLSQEEKRTVAIQIAFYKKYRKLFQYGRFIRLVNPDIFHAAWMVVSIEESEAIVGYYKLLSRPNQKPFRLRLKKLDAEVLYEVFLWEEGGFEEKDRRLNCGIRSGDELMKGGLILDTDMGTKGDFFSELFIIRRKSGEKT
jgi:alpha-galactosidase